MIASRPIRRAAALALLVAVAWAGGAWIVAPVLADILDTGAANQRAAALLGRSDRLAADIPALRRRLEAPGADPTGDEFLSPGSPAMLAAAMQEAAEKVVLASGAALDASHTLPAEVLDGFSRPGLEVDITANLETLRHLLVLLEAARPVIQVDRLAIQVPENGAISAGADAQPRYAVHMRLVSFARAAVASQAGQ